MRLIDVDALIAEYDKVHVGPAGGARKLMEDAPTIKPESNCSEIPNNWTPVSKETNPSTSGWYIVTCPEEMTASNERFSSIAEYNAVTGEWFDIDEPTDCYLAWMPLPAPFRRKEE